MSDTVDNVLNVVNESEPSEDVVVNEETSLVNEEETSVEEEAPVASEVEEEPVASETEETPVASEEEEAPVASEVEEAPVASEVEEAPVASEVEEAPVASETEEASVEPEVAPIEQVVSDIRDILSEDHPSNAWEEETNNSSLGDGIIIVSGIHKGKKFSEVLPHLLDTLREDQISVWINKQSIEGCDKINAFKYLKYFKANRH